jgi:hypothetical protein
MIISCCNIVSSILVILFSVNIARNIFYVYFVNRVTREAVLFIMEAISREENNDNIKRSNLVNNNNKKKTLLLSEIF